MLVWLSKHEQTPEQATSHIYLGAGILHSQELHDFCSTTFKVAATVPDLLGFTKNDFITHIDRVRAKLVGI